MRPPGPAARPGSTRWKQPPASATPPCPSRSSATTPGRPRPSPRRPAGSRSRPSWPGGAPIPASSSSGSPRRPARAALRTTSPRTTARATSYPPATPALATAEFSRLRPVARADPGDQDVLVLGAHVAGQLLRAGLLDEVRVHLVPLLLGEGTPLFAGERAELIPVGKPVAGAVTHLRYRVGK